MYKIKNGEYLANISNIFNVANNQAYSLRSNNTDYAFYKLKTNFLKKSISYSGAKTWNYLPAQRSQRLTIAAIAETEHFLF